MTSRDIISIWRAKWSEFKKYAKANNAKAPGARRHQWEYTHRVLSLHLVADHPQRPHSINSKGNN